MAVSLNIKTHSPHRGMSGCWRYWRGVGSREATLRGQAAVRGCSAPWCGSAPPARRACAGFELHGWAQGRSGEPSGSAQWTREHGNHMCSWAQSTIIKLMVRWSSGMIPPCQDLRTVLCAGFAVRWWPGFDFRPNQRFFLAQRHSGPIPFAGGDTGEAGATIGATCSENAQSQDHHPLPPPPWPWAGP